MAILNVPHPAVFLPFLRAHPEQLLKSWYMFFFQVPYLPELVVRKTGGLALRASSKSDTFSDTDLERYQEAWDQPGAMTGMINWYRAAARQRDFRSLPAPAATVPTLMVWGEEDAFLDRRMADQSIKLCKHGQLVKLSGVTHWLQHEAAGEVSRLLIEHFR